MLLPRGRVGLADFLGAAEDLDGIAPLVQLEPRYMYIYIYIYYDYIYIYIHIHT